MIDGVKTKKLKVVPDERGRLTEIMRNDDEMFEKFGQLYMTTNYPGVIKAWHFHKNQIDFVVCVKGMIKLVMFDSREDSPTKGEVNEFFIGEHNPMMVRIPNNVYHGWKCISETESMVVNCPTELYDYKAPDEERLAYNSPEIPYDWSLKHG
jgi:dTDP-4-dehydrorhamnose 3,5-epimerase